MTECNLKSDSTNNTTGGNVMFTSKRTREDSIVSYINSKHNDDKDRILEVYETFCNEMLTPKTRGLL